MRGVLGGLHVSFTHLSFNVGKAGGGSKMKRKHGKIGIFEFEY